MWRKEPVRIVEAVRALLIAGVSVGAFVLEDAQITAIVAAVAAVLSVFADEVIRSKVYSPATVEDMGVLDPPEDDDPFYDGEPE